MLRTPSNSPISHAASGTPALIAHGHATLDYALSGERAPSQITLYRSGVTKDLGVTGPYEVEEPAPTLSHESALACWRRAGVFIMAPERNSAGCSLPAAAPISSRPLIGLLLVLSRITSSSLGEQTTNESSLILAYASEAWRTEKRSPQHRASTQHATRRHKATSGRATE